MRLRRLGLTRYGIFTDHSVDFGERHAGKPDLHIVYGPNESGKSTALAGFLDLLFGFELRSRYAFVHGYNAMQVDAALQINGESHQFVRVRSREGSLRGSDGKPVSEAVIAKALGGLNRDTYRAMFSLDDDTLEAGGEEILKSEGDLGRLLFSSGAGLVELSETLDGLRKAAQNFHRPRARTTALHKLKDRLSQIEREKRELDISASAHARLVDERDAASSEYDEAVADRAKLEAGRETALRRLDGLRQLSEIRPLRRELAELIELPEAPQVWFDQIGGMLTEEPRLIERIQGLRNRQTGLTARREALPTDDAVLELEDRLGNIDRARARYETAHDDLPRRRDSLVELRGRISAITRRLDKTPDTDPALLVISSGTVGLLHELIEQRSGVEERLKTAEKEQETAKSVAETAEREFKQAVGSDQHIEEASFHRLSSVLETIQADGYRERLELHTDQRNRRRIELHALVAQLHPWGRDAESLVSVRVPEQEELDEWQSILDEVEREIQRIEHEKSRQMSERRRLTQRLSMKTAESDVVDDKEASQLRRLRDEAWVSHRVKLDTESASVFEQRMKNDDAATAGRVAHATTLAELRQTNEALSDIEAEIERSVTELSLASRRRREVLDRIASSVSVMSRSGADDLPPDISLPKLNGWMARRARILSVLGEIDRESAKIENAVSDAERLRGMLADALTGAGLPHEPANSLDELMRTVREAVSDHRDRRVELQNAGNRLNGAKEELERRERDARQAADNDATWRSKWSSALSSCWLGEGDPIPTAPEVRRILEDISALEGILGEHAELSVRIRTMERDQSAYSDLVKSLMEELDGVFDPEQPVSQGEDLKARLAAAIDNREARERLGEEINGLAENIRSEERELSEMNAVASKMFEAFGVDSLQAVNERLAKVRRREGVRSDVAKREAELIASMNAESVESAESELGDASRESLRTEIAEISTQLEEANERVQNSYHRLRSAREAIDRLGGDDAVARLEGQRRTCLLEIEDGASAYVRARLGIEAAELALRAYRDEHRSSMMKRASEAFRTISRGAYRRLESRLNGQGEVLIGIATDGGSKIASEMSKGARFQLYLALRVAGYREFVERHGPVPFVADDILETFDDFRAEEAFRLFSDMASVGQVVYLGHHRHLCDIARDVCPGVSIHELPEP